MANLPSIATHPHLARHLADRALTPILSSSRNPSSSRNSQSQTQAQALSSLTTAAITAYDMAARLGLGLPQRIMIETQSSGPTIFHSYINPPSTQRPQIPHAQDQENVQGIVEQAQDGLRPLTGTTDAGSVDEPGESSEVLVNGIPHNEEVVEEDEESSIQPPPLLIASVVAPTAADAIDARRAAARLERTGREFQREWLREQASRNEIVEDEDG